MKLKHILTGMLVWIIPIFTTCIDEDVCPPYTPGEASVTFTLQMPRSYADAAATTGLTDEEENIITSLTILLFNTNAAGNLVCTHYLGGLTPTAVPATDNQRYTLTAQIPEGSYHFMLLANLPDGKLTEATTVGFLRTDIESTLQFEMQAKWDITAHTGFPMWGMSDGELTVPGSYVNTNAIPMLRMLSRINISVTEELQEFIKIKSIKLHNPSSRGQVIPAEANLDRTTNPGYIRVIAPTLPLNSASNPDPGLLATPWEYGATNIEDEAHLHNTLYAMEGFDPQGLEDDEYAWLEIIATYKDKEEKPYRVDFWQKETDGSRTPLPILRNHTYEITIVGMDEIEEDIEVIVLVRDDGDINVEIDGQYQLKVNKASFVFDREERDEDSFNNNLDIYTNHEDGWEITSVTDPDNDDAEIDMDNGWLRILPEHRKGNQGDTTIKLLLDKNTGSNPRKAEIRLQVGRLLDFVVKVTQGTTTELELAIEDLDGNPINELFFHEYYGWEGEHTSQDIRVRWSPKGRTYHCKVEIGLSGDQLFEFDSPENSIVPGKLDNEDGSRHYTIAPQAFTQAEVSEDEGNPFLHRGTRITFTVTDEQDATKSINKTLYLRHQHFAIISKDLLKDSPLDDSYEFSVLSNTTWVLENVEEGIATATSAQGTTGGNDIQSGDPLTYTLPVPAAGNTMPGYRQAGRKVTFYLRDQQELIPDLVPFTITATYNDPNSYILNPAGSDTERTVDIPIRKLFWVWELYAGQPLENITADNLEGGVVWDEVYLNSDLNGSRQNYNITTQFIPDNSNVLESVLRVTIPLNPNVSGNAVVGIKPKGAGDTQWLYSWHLWITGYNPDSGADEDQFIVGTNPQNIIMTRNLGALENDPSVMGQSVNGLFYQWGRKDPMHPSFASASSPIVNTANNLGNALNNPKVFYRAPGGLQDWFTNENNPEYQNGYLWSTRNINDPDNVSQNNRKGIFDPCPRGWRLTGFDWDELEHELTPINGYSRYSVQHNGRYISEEFYDPTTGDQSVFHYAGIISPDGIWGQHTLSTGDEEMVSIAMRSYQIDNPTRGTTYRVYKDRYNAGQSVMRATASTTRCVKEK